ncbi:sphingoid long-chain bases kinase 1 [Phtheirospermum japonicum]|uniref:Sphingoid long-chain bases kinase 1 n=1 Tax=Phtheirospermum japonicum TaxID=374723 RepID=A0A830C896_9LAMI|nr:sphingoid long-chain bases kinase 1 [Phtheirospermum japonicum]
MQKSVSLSKHSSLRLTTQQSLRRLGLCSQVSTGQQTSPVVFPEKRNSRGKATTVNNDNPNEAKRDEHRIDVGDEKSDLLGYEVFSGKLSLDKSKACKNLETQTASENANLDAVDAKLTSKALIWGSNIVRLDDVISLSCCVGLRHFTLHSYPNRKGSCRLFTKSVRSRKDFRFFASTSEDAIQWVNAFADQQCYVNCLPHPMASKKQSSNLIFNEFPLESYVKCKSPPKMLVILNPRSGRGRSSKVFHGVVEPIFKPQLAGFELEVVKTQSAGHARKLAASVDFSTCPDGIICVGGDGIINEVLNGLLSRGNQKEAISIPIGIIPAGSDNSLVWTVLGVRDPVSAAIAIVKGGLTATDVFAVEWIHTGAIHFGMTVTYFGFISDVLELSEKYQKRFGPLRYFVAGFLKFFCLPKYSYELEYLPARTESGEGKVSGDHEIIDMSELYTDIMRRSSKEGLPRASSLSSIDSIMTPSRMSGADVDTTCSSNEPSEYVRAIDPKSKRLSAGRSNVAAEPEVIHPQLPHSVTPNWPRTRSKSRTDKGWAVANTTNNNSNDPTRCSWATTTTYDKEDISSTLSDPGPIWDAEPRWDSEPNWAVENPIELPGPSEGGSEAAGGDNKKENTPRPEENWVVTKGQFLGVLICNHSCKTVQSLSSQVVAPKAEHDDNSLDLLLVRGSGRFKLLRFFLRLQMGKHLSLPYVEYIKVKSVKIKPGKHTHNGCGIDGELFPVNGQLICSLLPEQCRLIGRPPSSSK